MRQIIIGIMSFLLAACGAASNSEVLGAAQMQATMQAYGTEAAQLQLGWPALRTQAAATIAAVQGEAAFLNEYNALLVATVRVGEASTPSQRVEARGVIGTGADGVFSVGNAFVAASIGADGCMTQRAQYFTPSSGVIYVVAQALNITRGSTVMADWWYEGQRAYQNSWVAEEAEASRCVPLELRPELATFSVGNWYVQVYADGTLVQDIPFSILAG